MLTIIIPTKNRPQYLSRLLEYYVSQNCQFPILIGDSSDDFYLAQAQKITQKYLDLELNITWMIKKNVSSSFSHEKNGLMGWVTRGSLSY